MNSMIPYSSTSRMLSTPEQSNTMVKYTQAIATTVFLGVSILRFLLLSGLLVVALVLWLWSISFQTGRLFGQWCLTEKPNAAQTVYKLGEIILFPFVLLAAWSRQKVKELWQIELPLIPESVQPQKCSELFTSNDE